MVPVVAQAQATRTWVSGAGDDALPCSRTAPCRSFAGAVSKTAAGGEVDAMTSGAFGPVVLTKSMTLEGRGGPNAVLNALLGADAVVINAGPTDVVILRNLHIEGTGGGRHGVRVVSAGSVQLEDCVISGFSGDGILVEASGAKLLLSNVVVRQNAGAGVSLNASGVAATVKTSPSRRTATDSASQTAGAPRCTTASCPATPGPGSSRTRVSSTSNAPPYRGTAPVCWPRVRVAWRGSPR